MPQERSGQCRTSGRATDRDRPRDPSAVGELLRMFRREFEPELLAVGVDAEHLTFRSLRKTVAAAVSDTAGVEVARDLIVEIAADALDEVFAGIDA